MQKQRTKREKDAIKIKNPLWQYDPDQPEYIPAKFTQGLNRSMYLSPEKAVVFYCVQQMLEVLGDSNINEAVGNGLELWVEKHKKRYLETMDKRVTAKADAIVAACEKEGCPDDITEHEREINRKLVRALSHIDLELGKFSDSPSMKMAKQVLAYTENEISQQDFVCMLLHEAAKRLDDSYQDKISDILKSVTHRNVERQVSSDDSLNEKKLSQ
jgi:hypothetical protein